MRKNKLYEFMMKHISAYFFEIDKSQLEIAILSGFINLYKLKLNSKNINLILDKLNIPFHLKAGMINVLTIKVINYIKNR